LHCRAGHANTSTNLAHDALQVFKARAVGNFEKGQGTGLARAAGAHPPANHDRGAHGGHAGFQKLLHHHAVVHCEWMLQSGRVHGGGGGLRLGVMRGSVSISHDVVL
jgi:hypothetical protein